MAPCPRRRASSRRPYCPSTTPRARCTACTRRSTRPRRARRGVRGPSSDWVCRAGRVGTLVHDGGEDPSQARRRGCPAAGPVLRRGRAARSLVGAARAAPQPTAAPTRWSGRATRRVQGDRALPRALRRRRRHRARARAARQARADRRTSSACSASRAASPATCRRASSRAGGAERAVRAARARPSRSRSSTAPGRSSTSPSRQIDDAVQRAAAAARQQADAGGRRGRAQARAQARLRRGRAGEQARRAGAQQLVQAQFAARRRSQLALQVRADRACRSSTTRASSTQLVFDPARGAGTPKPRFAYLFPTPRRGADPGAAQARPHATPSARAAIALIRRAVRDARLAAAPTAAATSSPARRSWSRDLTDAASPHSLVVLLVAALLVMAVDARARLPRAAAAAAAASSRSPRPALTFGALALAGAPLTMASIARAAGAASAWPSTTRSSSSRGSRGGGRRRAARRCSACRRSPPPALATAAGFLVLALSPVPMVRGFGLLLVVGHRARARCCAAHRRGRRRSR